MILIIYGEIYPRDYKAFRYPKYEYALVFLYNFLGFSANAECCGKTQKDYHSKHFCNNNKKNTIVQCDPNCQLLT